MTTQQNNSNDEDDVSLEEKIIPLEEAIKLSKEKLGKNKFTNLTELYDEIREFIYKHADLLESSNYDLLTAFVLITYKYHKIDFVPYILLLGDTRTRKN